MTSPTPFFFAVLVAAGLVQEGVIAQAKSESTGVLLDAGGDLSGFLGSNPLTLSHVDVAAVCSELPPDIELATTRTGLIESGANPDRPRLTGVIAEMVSFTKAPPDDRLGHGIAVASDENTLGRSDLFFGNEREEMIKLTDFALPELWS